MAKRRHYFHDGSMGDFGFGAGREHIAGPLIGGGATQVGILAAKMIFKAKPNVSKWSGLIGLALGAGISGALAARPASRATGISGLVTAALIGIPRQIEDMMMPAATAGYLGVVTPEQGMMGYGGGFGVTTPEQGMYGAESEVQLLDSGSGGGVFGVTVPEADMEGMQGAGPVELLGGGGFGTNFLSSQ